MRWVRLALIVILVTLIGGFLHYTLPQREVVRITDTQLQLTEISGWTAFFYAQSDSGTDGTSIQRDVRIISAVRPGPDPDNPVDSDDTIDFRNEDTGLFGWPPYFKIDSQDLQTAAQDLRSTREDPIWVAVTHYGWRNNVLSSYPNAISITRVDGPDVTFIPWVNILILFGIALFFFMAWRIWERFEDRVIDPFRDSVAVRWAKLKDSLAGRRSGL